MIEEENDSIRPIEQFKLRIKEKGIAFQCLFDYFNIAVEAIDQKSKKVENSIELYQILKQNILSNKCEFKEFLVTLLHLWKTHQQNKEINYKIESLFKILNKDIKNFFSEKEIFDIFYRNIVILLILVEQNILSIETIIQNINLNCRGDWTLKTYFYPEIRKYDEKYFNELMIKNDLESDFKEFIEKNDQNLELFYKIRKEGEKESKIIELIKEDKINEFISFIELSPIDLIEKIKIEKKLIQLNTPIEYSALYGSINIFKYLYMKEVNINVIDDYDNHNIFKYAVDGRNYEIIHLLEERKEIMEELNNQENKQKFLKEPIKMHHNEIFEYFITKYNYQVSGEIISLIIKYRNYELLNQLIERNQIDFKNIAIINNIFKGICKNDNEEIVKILINLPNLDINSKDNIFEYFLEKIKMKKR